MKKIIRHITLIQFKGYCIPMVAFSIFVLLFIIVFLMGVPLPLDAQTFEGSEAVRIVSAVSGVLGIISGILGIKAAAERNDLLLKICAVSGIIIVVLFCSSMLLADGHTNPHAWILLGMTSIVPGSFGGTALRLLKNGWDD